MPNDNTDFTKSAAAVVLRDGCVLLARHTYGAGKGRLIIPGGYVNHGESPEDAVIRELLEETGIHCAPAGILGIRFNTHDWYIVFRADYINGEACSDGCENDEVLWLPVDEALRRDDVPHLTKALLRSAVSPHNGLLPTPYEGNAAHAPYSLYC